MSFRVDHNLLSLAQRDHSSVTVGLKITEFILHNTFRPSQMTEVRHISQPSRSCFHKYKIVKLCIISYLAVMIDEP